MKIKTTIPVYNSLLVVFTGSFEIYAKEVKNQLDIECENNGAVGQCCGSYIWIKTKDDIATLAHELHHYVKNWAKHVNVEDEEAEAYIMGWCMSYIWHRLSK